MGKAEREKLFPVTNENGTLSSFLGAADDRVLGTATVLLYSSGFIHLAVGIKCERYNLHLLPQIRWNSLFPSIVPRACLVNLGDIE